MANKFLQRLKEIFLPGKSKEPRSKTREWTDAIIFAVVAATLIRWVAIEAFTIPTPSMEKSLLVGDFLFVSKLHYGPRTPKTPLQLPLTHQTIWGTGIPSYLDWIELPQFRLPGFVDVKNNDVVVFNYPRETEHPSDLRTNYIKRCLGIGGDTIEVRDLQVYINGVAAENPPKMQNSYYLRTNTRISEKNFRKFDITGVNPVQGGYVVKTTPVTAETLKGEPYLDEVRLLFTPDGQSNSMVYPYDKNLDWSEDNYGPLYIPKEGDVMPVNEEFLTRYGMVVTDYEGHDQVLIQNGELLIDGEKVTEYTFSQNYYFMMGDNRHNSADSRFWGFVPEDHIVGKALLIWMSIDPDGGLLDKIRWNRLFSFIE